MASDDRFLPKLTQSLDVLEGQNQMPTEDFCAAMSLILPVFDHLGVFFHFAKAEMGGKVTNLDASKGQMATLDDVVGQCRADGTLTVKNSPARNLHRLVSAVDFIRVLLEDLSAEPPVTLHTACSSAYQKTLAGIHTFVVRTAVYAGMYTLPSRANFLASIGESDVGPHSKVNAQAFVSVAEKVTRRITSLYGNSKMPRSDSTWTG